MTDSEKIASMAEYAATLLTDGARDLRAGRPIDGQHIMDIATAAAAALNAITDFAVNPMMGLSERMGLLMRPTQPLHGSVVRHWPTLDDGPFADGLGWVRCGKCDGRLATYEPCEDCP